MEISAKLISMSRLWKKSQYRDNSEGLDTSLKLALMRMWDFHLYWNDAGMENYIGPVVWAAAAVLGSTFGKYWKLFDFQILFYFILTPNSGQKDFLTVWPWW